MSPAFALTEYKIQGSTCLNAALDLYQRYKARGEDALHKRYCSLNVQLSRLQSLEGLQLLQRLSLNDLDIKPHRLLCEEDYRLQQLADMTMRLETESILNRIDA